MLVDSLIARDLRLYHGIWVKQKEWSEKSGKILKYFHNIVFYDPIIYSVIYSEKEDRVPEISLVP